MMPAKDLKKYSYSDEKFKPDLENLKMFELCKYKPTKAGIPEAGIPESEALDKKGFSKLLNSSTHAIVAHDKARASTLTSRGKSVPVRGILLMCAPEEGKHLPPTVIGDQNLFFKRSEGPPFAKPQPEVEEAINRKDLEGSEKIKAEATISAKIISPAQYQQGIRVFDVVLLCAASTTKGVVDEMIYRMLTTIEGIVPENRDDAIIYTAAAYEPKYEDKKRHLFEFYEEELGYKRVDLDLNTSSHPEVPLKTTWSELHNTVVNRSISRSR